jgi:hypothetical protein
VERTRWREVFRRLALDNDRRKIYVTQTIDHTAFLLHQGATEGYVHHALLQSPKTAVLSLASLIFLGTVAQADPINVNYSTSMFISDIGRSGTAVVGYAGVTGASLSTQAATGFGTVLNPLPSGVGSGLPLGEIAITPPPAAQGVQWSATYNDTPFYLTVNVNSVNGDTHAANPSSYVVDGYLTGSLSGSGPSSLTATFVRPDSVSPSYPAGTIASFSSGGYDTFLSIPYGTTTISSPNGIPAGLSLLGGVVAEYATPEPASLVVLGFLGLAQVGAFRTRSRRRRGLAA